MGALSHECWLAAPAFHDLLIWRCGTHGHESHSVERLHEAFHRIRVGCSDDQIQFMFTVHHGFSLDSDSRLRRAGEQIEQQSGSFRLQIGSRGGVMFVPHPGETQGGSFPSDVFSVSIPIP